MTDWLTGKLNIAHRGASAAAPQNTMAAFEKAVELGADAIEFDVHLSADGVPVVIHDYTVDTTTDGSGLVAELPLAQLEQLDAGSHVDPAFAGERIPTLEKVLQAFGRRILLNVELKSETLQSDGLERTVLALLDPYPDRVLISSFNPFSLWRVKRLAPHIPVGLLYKPDQSLPLRRGWLGALFSHEARHPQHTMVDANYISWARRRGYRVNAWTVNEPAEMQRLIDLGVDGIVTDVPDVLHTVLRTAR